MRAHRLQKNCDNFCRQDKMGAQLPKAADSNAPSFRSADPSFCLPPSTPSVEASRDASGSAWSTSILNQEGQSHEEKHFTDRLRGSRPAKTRTGRNAREVPERLEELLMHQLPAEGEELAGAFREAFDYPPITKQSLSELDIQNIITNPRLRHDVNFDRDLSFRPNLDGPKGQEKVKAAQKYWRALVAELELYNLLFQGSVTKSFLDGIHLNDVIHHAQRRIPKMFSTIQEVLKSLVPDRDHSRVDEHLDVPMMMQEVERGVCDLVRRAEWMAHLLKEHCAPMRDEWVDKMVNDTRSGVSTNSSDLIVEGLRELVGILEAMKLDVANHQIRNLKTLLIEDTVNFERHYHLDRIVNGKARFEIKATQKWYATALETFSQQCMPQQKDFGRFQLEVFVREVVSILMCKNDSKDFPESFYLDYDRLMSTKAEVHDLVFIEICFEMLAQLLRRLGYDGPISSVTLYDLRKSLTDLLGDGAGHGPQQWMMNSESLSLEIVRAACAIACKPLAYNFGDLHDANQQLRNLFDSSFAAHAVNLETILLQQVLDCTNLHLHSSPLNLFNNLVPTSNPPTPAPIYVNPALPHTFVQQHTDTFPSSQSFAFETAKLTELSNRISHIILLHWRVWGPIAYVQEDDKMNQQQTTSTKSSEDNVSGSPMPQSQRSQASVEQETKVIPMKTGELSESGQETHVAHETTSQ